ncbi:hypothetical protein, partial [Mycoplasma tauri]|nr:hypothetical protein [Mycoplasma tauri]
INAILTIVITTLIFWINSKSFENGTNLYLEHSKKYLFYPFNFITYIFGLSIVKISILFSLIKFKERRLKK